MDVISVINAFVDPILSFLPKLPEAIIDLAVGYVLIKILVWAFEHLLRITRIPKLKGILVSMAKVGLWLILIIVIAGNLGFSNLAVAISGSVLILAFVLNNGLAPLVSDVLSGIFLCTDQDFRPGSLVRIGKGKEATEARIVEVDMRKVRLVDGKGLVHIIPNSVVDKGEWSVLEKSEATSLVKTKAAVVKEAIKKRVSVGKSK